MNIPNLELPEKAMEEATKPIVTSMKTGVVESERLWSCLKRGKPLFEERRGNWKFRSDNTLSLMLGALMGIAVTVGSAIATGYFDKEAAKKREEAKNKPQQGGRQ